MFQDCYSDKKSDIFFCFSLWLLTKTLVPGSNVGQLERFVGPAASYWEGREKEDLPVL